ncbi:MAG: carbohydrate kinase family protein [bacterium]|nr:carbohydrate kinase family protein [bacterium]
MLNLLVIGDALLDTHVQIDDATVACNLDGKNCKLCLDYAHKIPITGSFQTIGGDGANIAVGATKLGLSAALVATVGKDANAGILLEALNREKVQTDFIFTDNQAQTRYSVVLNFQGERTILSFHAQRKYVWPETMPALDWIYYTGLSEGFEVLQKKLINYLGKHPSVRLAFTPGTYQLKNFLAEMRDAVPKADILIVNLEEAEQLAGITLKKSKSMASLLHKLLAMGAKEVAITDGANGAWAGDSEHIWHQSSYPVKVVAKTGAGDAFSAAYVAARFYGHDSHEALRWGTANSCAKISHAGGGWLDQAGVARMTSDYKKYQPEEVGV